MGDVTIADNTILHLGESFVKTWRIQNVGTCPWTTGYKLVFVGGDKLAGPDSDSLPMDVAPEQAVDISVNLSAPSTPGHYQGFWLLQSPEGRSFGVGGSATMPLWFKVTVIGPPLDTPTSTPGIFPTATVSTLNPAEKPPAPLEVAADFVREACAAQWQSAYERLACPGRGDDPRGFVLPMEQATLEDGTSAPVPALLSSPPWSRGGYILGIYPEYVVQPGDHFQASVGCEFKALSCSVLFTVSYIDTAGAAHALWTQGEFYDGRYFNQDLDLSHLVGQKIRFVLSVANLRPGRENRALWVAPRIVRFEGTAPAEIETSMPALPSPAPMPSLTATAASTPTAQSTSTPQSTSTVYPTQSRAATATALQTRVPAMVQTSVPPGGTPQPLGTIQQILELVGSYFRSLFGGK